MIRFVSLVSLSLIGFAPLSLPAMAASFDCAKAGTPFEHAICDNPKLSAADEQLAKTFATAIGGLSDTALDRLRTDQRDWLAFAQLACTKDAKPLTKGSYSSDGADCLTSLFNDRSTVLEGSRMSSGLRFYPIAKYSAVVDPNEVGNADSSYPLATHQLSMVQIDSDQPFAKSFNQLVAEQAGKLSAAITGDEGSDAAEDNSSDTDNAITLKEIAGDNRIALDVNTYWYSHGAAHGNYTIGTLNFLKDKARFLEASDIFAAKDWKAKLLELTVAALKDEHGDNLMLDNPSDIADSVADPTRWDLSDPYGLVIQFQPYEVAAYAYGAPTARVSWDKLQPYLAENAESIRDGY